MGHFETYLRDDGKYDWKLVAANGETLCSSDQGYRDEHDVHRAIRAVLMAVQDAALAAFDMKSTVDLSTERRTASAPN